MPYISSVIPSHVSEPQDYRKRTVYERYPISNPQVLPDYHYLIEVRPRGSITFQYHLETHISAQSIYDANATVTDMCRALFPTHSTVHITLLSFTSSEECHQVNYINTEVTN